MPKYANGRVPYNALVQLDSGGGKHWSSPKGAAMWYALRRNVQQKYGKTLHITEGMNGYRDWDEQGFGRRKACAQGNCNAAAAQGYSSHGGTWRSAKYTGGVWVDAMAFDIGDYGQIGQAAFYAEARAVGFEAGLITPEIAGIFEPWHLIVFDPWGAVPASVGATPFDSSFIETESDMRVIKSPNRPWTLIGPGASRVLSAEEAGNTVWPKHDLNDRQFDLNVAMSVGPVETQPVGGMVVIEDNAKVRPVALVGPGYYRALNDEEASNVGVLASRREVGNTRQYDLWVSIALAGQGASFPVAAANLSALSDADVQRLAEAAADEADRRDRERLGS